MKRLLVALAAAASLGHAHADDALMEAMAQPWTGDLDGLVERKMIRVLTVYSKTFYFVNQGVQRGATYDFVRQFEEDLNKRLAKEKKLKQKHLKVRAVFIPVARSDLLQSSR